MEFMEPSKLDAILPRTTLIPEKRSWKAGLSKKQGIPGWNNAAQKNTNKVCLQGHEPACQKILRIPSQKEKYFGSIATTKMRLRGSPKPLSSLRFFNKCLEPEPAKQPAIKQASLCKLHTVSPTLSHTVQRSMNLPLS